MSAGLAALTGCADGERPALPPASIAPAHYSGLSGECPILRSPESRRFTGSREGRRVPAPGHGAFEFVNCSWRSPSGAPWVTLAVIVHRNGFAPTQTGHGNASLDLTRAREEAAGGTGTDPSGATRTAERATSSGPAVLRANGAEHQLTQTSVAGNVVVKVLLFETKTSGVDAGARADELMATLAATTEAIAAEVVAQLIPQPA